MSRPVRTLLIAGVIVIGGFVALGLLADRYRRALPMKSVNDLPSIGVPATPPPLASPSPAASAAPATAAAPVSLREVDAFIAARKGMKGVFDGYGAGEVKKLRAEATGDTKYLEGKRSRMYFDVAFALVMARKTAYAAAGVPESSYGRVLEAYQARQAGKPVGDRDLAAAFDAKKDALAGADLGDYAFLDRMVPP